jgi:hypothetical protein
LQIQFGEGKMALVRIIHCQIFSPADILVPGARTTVRTDRQQVVINEQLGELLKSA